MLVFDFFAGTRSSTKAFEDAGHTVISFDNDPQFDVTVQADVFMLLAGPLIERFGQPDFVWASPPCTSFSVASIGHHWNADHTPKTHAAVKSMELVAHTRALLEALRPRLGFVIENPRGKLRKLPMLDGLTRHTVTYCAYGDDRMKPTDLWTTIVGWTPRQMCSNGDPCHESAPRGAKTGTQGRSGAVARSMVPYALGSEILDAVLGLDKGEKVEQ
jgi:hypothetical protein